MLSLKSILTKYTLKPYRYEKHGKTTYIDTNNGRFVIKKNNKDEEILNYLKSRNFDYIPSTISNQEDEYEISEYIEETNIPIEQKIMDLIDLVSLLHNKTTHYKEVGIEYYKQIYEDISNNIAYLYSYYTDLITMIENKVFMSPSEYLLARNITKIYASLNFSKLEIDKWYELVKDKKKDRFVVIHNNLDLSHFLRNDASYLISWDKSRIDKPIFDLYKLYKRHLNDIDFSEVLTRYERNYPLLEEERILLFILITLPDKIDLEDDEYEMTKKIDYLVSSLYRTETFISPYYSKNTKYNE
ncbi:MAG: hypothetical protein E7169_00285 [Firmicutes bacterium]|nr:hypothetical protein [Bacillota bacterium]